MRLQEFRRRIVATLLPLLAACAPAVQETAPAGAQPAPAPDAGQLAASLQQATLPASPRQIAFSWQLDEAGAGFRGRGVARYVAPQRFRLDLFGPRGETYLAAALVDGEARVPAAVQERFRLPSPALLWAAVGVFQPPADARITGSRVEEGITELRYDAGEAGTLEFRARGDDLISVRRLRGGGIQETVELDRGPDGTLTRARYRDWQAFRTLTLTLESSQDTNGFSEDIWTPPGAGR